MYQRRPRIDTDNLIFGINPIEEACDAGKEFEKIFIQKGLDKEKFTKVLKYARSLGIPVSEVPIQKLSQYTLKQHQGIVAFLSVISYQSLDTIIDSCFEKGKDPLIIALDNVTDVRNFGAIARSAEVLGVNAILIPSKGGAMINGDAIKTSAGALNHIPVCRENRLIQSIEFLKNRGLRIVSCTEKTDKLIYNSDFKGPLCIVLGAEDLGISQDIIDQSDEKCKIPMLGQIESLNVSVAAGIILYEAHKQRIS